MTQAGAFAAGIFGGAKQDVPFQRIDETSYADGSLGAIDLLRPRQEGAYRAGVLGSVAQPGSYRGGSLGLNPAQAAQAAAAASQAATQAAIAKAQTHKRTRGSYSQKQVRPLSAAAQAVAARRARCKMDCVFKSGGKNSVLMDCQQHCDSANPMPLSGLGLLETVPSWALYAGGAAVVLGAGYFLFGKKRR